MSRKKAGKNVISLAFCRLNYSCHGEINPPPLVINNSIWHVYLPRENTYILFPSHKPNHHRCLIYLCSSSSSSQALLSTNQRWWVAKPKRVGGGISRPESVVIGIGKHEKLCAYDYKKGDSFLTKVFAEKKYLKPCQTTNFFIASLPYDKK